MPHATTFVTIIGRVLRDDSVHTEGTSQLSVCIIVEVVKMRTGSGSDQGGHTGCGLDMAPDLDPIGQGVYVPNEVVPSTGPLLSTGGGARFIVDHGRPKGHERRWR